MQTGRRQVMKTWQGVAVIAASMICAALVGPANATTITTIRFVDIDDLAVFIKNDNGPDVRQTQFGRGHPLLDLAPERARTAPLTTICATCNTGIRGVVLFEPGASQVSDFIFAITTFGRFPPALDTRFFFESDPDILFYANNSPFVRREERLLNRLTTMALAGRIPKIDETGEEQVLFDSSNNINLFRDATGALSPLPTNNPFLDFAFEGHDFVIKVTSDISEIPEPTTLLLFGTTAAGLGLASWRQRRRKAIG
jgi:hypothetical protein